MSFRVETLNSVEIIRAVEHAAFILGTGGTIEVVGADSSVVVRSAESYMSSEGYSGNKLILSPQRAEIITGKQYKSYVSLSVTDSLPAPIDDITGATLKQLDDSVASKLAQLFQMENNIYCVAMKVAKIAELIPALVTCDADKIEFSVNADAVIRYEEEIAKGLEPVVRGPLVLENALQAQMVVFKANGSQKEHYAVIVGDPSREDAPMVRIHSCCFTGDVLASMRCDCGPQLQGALKKMSDNGSGIILYLVQEGRVDIGS